MVLDVLVVDDSDIIRTMILKTLRLANLPIGTAYEASNGKEALHLLEDNWVDLVLADINMPVMNGLQLIEHMRQSADLANIPVVIVSTEGNAARIDELKEQGIAAYVRKPFTPERIRDVVGDVTAGWTKDDHADLVEDVFHAILERFTFMYGDQVSKENLPGLSEPALHARITFTGAIEGAMGLAAPRSLCSEMVANLIGDSSDKDRLSMLAADALAELLNMACGHVTNSLASDTAVDLAPPVVTALAAEDWDRMAGAHYTFGFLIEDKPALLGLSVRPAK